jgi:hypothetical protein
MPSIETSVSMLSKSLETQGLVAKMITEPVENMAENKSGQNKIQNSNEQIPPPSPQGKGTLIDEVV